MSSQSVNRSSQLLISNVLVVALVVLPLFSSFLAEARGQVWPEECRFGSVHFHLLLSSDQTCLRQSVLTQCFFLAIRMFVYSSRISPTSFGFRDQSLPKIARGTLITHSFSQLSLCVCFLEYFKTVFGFCLRKWLNLLLVLLSASAAYNHNIIKVDASQRGQSRTTMVEPLTERTPTMNSPPYRKRLSPRFIL